MAYTGNSIVDYLKSVGQASDFASRSALAASKGIQNYSGTAEQNTQLLGLLRTPVSSPAPVSQPVSQPQPNSQGFIQSGISPVSQPQPQVNNQGFVQSGNQLPTTNIPTTQPITQPTQQTGSIVDYLNSVGKPSDFASRSQLAAQYGIQGYTGTAEQNTQLLNAVRGSGQAPTSQAPTVESPTAQPIDENRQKLIDELSTKVKDIQGQLDTIQQAKDKGMQITPQTTYEEAASFLSDYGVNVDEGKTVTNPSGSWQDTYQQLFSQLGLDKVKTNIDDTIAKIEALNNERAEKAAIINDNPWISEAERSRQISKLNDEYDGKESSLTNALTLYQDTYNQGREEAQFLVTTALSQYNAEREFDLEEQKMLADQAEANAKAAADLAKINPAVYKEVQGGLYNVETGEWVIGPKATSDTGLTKAQILAQLSSLRTAARQDPDIKAFTEVRAAYEGAVSAADMDSSTGDITLMRYIAKMTDPTSSVREEEFATFKGAQGVLARYGIGLTKGMIGKGQLTDYGREQLLKVAENIYSQRLNAYNNAQSFYDTQAASFGIPEGNVVPKYEANTVNNKSTISGLEKDIRNAIKDKANFKTREELITALSNDDDYSDMSVDEIAAKVYSIWKDNTNR